MTYLPGFNSPHWHIMQDSYGVTARKDQCQYESGFVVFFALLSEGFVQKLESLSRCLCQHQCFCCLGICKMLFAKRRILPSKEELPDPQVSDEQV